MIYINGWDVISRMTSLLNNCSLCSTLKKTSSMLKAFHSFLIYTNIRGKNIIIIIITPETETEKVWLGVTLRQIAWRQDIKWKGIDKCLSEHWRILSLFSLFFRFAAFTLRVLRDLIGQNKSLCACCVGV